MRYFFNFNLLITIFPIFHTCRVWSYILRLLRGVGEPQPHTTSIAANGQDTAACAWCLGMCVVSAVHISPPLSLLERL